MPAEKDEPADLVSATFPTSAKVFIGVCLAVGLIAGFTVGYFG